MIVKVMLWDVIMSVVLDWKMMSAESVTDSVSLRDSVIVFTTL